jgi:hypothetical protein
MADAGWLSREMESAPERRRPNAQGLLLLIRCGTQAEAGYVCLAYNGADHVMYYLNGDRVQLDEPIMC